MKNLKKFLPVFLLLTILLSSCSFSDAVSAGWSTGWETAKETWRESKLNEAIQDFGQRVEDLGYELVNPPVVVESEGADEADTADTPKMCMGTYYVNHGGGVEEPLHFEVEPGVHYLDFSTPTERRTLTVHFDKDCHSVGGGMTLFVAPIGGFPVTPTEAAPDTDVIPSSSAVTGKETLDVPMSVTTDWFSGNVPASGIVTIKRHSPGCTMPKEVCHVFSQEGVLGADNLADANANESAVHTGNAVYHASPDQREFGVIGPEGSYTSFFAKQFDTVVIGDPADNPTVLHIPSCGDNCAQGLLIRSPFAQDGIDLNLPIAIDGYGSVGALSWTRYVVPVHAAQWFSQTDWNANVASSFVFDSNGIGPKDTFRFVAHIFDSNDGSYTVMETTDGGVTWHVLWTNVIRHGSK